MYTKKLIFISFRLLACMAGSLLLHAQEQYDSTQKKYIDSLLAGYQLVQKDTIGHSYSVVQIPAYFPGGITAWTDYLKRNMNTDLGTKYIKLKKSESVAKRTVIVSFNIQPTGLVSDVLAVPAEADADVHPKLIEEAIRVVSESPRWQPAQQESFENINGKLPVEQVLGKKQKGFRKVIYRLRQSIIFVNNG